ncbi:MAG: LmbE family N-acetylglucosaminyl deacetylase [Candidatus Marinamargulisbacteria bacterium]|jgi:LmbE family N-acetylglucosaminyl deacetylase
MILVIVAHPDDECLWFGDTISRITNSGLNVLIICLTNKNHPERSAEFSAACQSLRATGIMLDLPEGGNQRFPAFGSDISEILQAQEIDIDAISMVVTHSPHGEELRHWQHIQTYLQVKAFCRHHNRTMGFFSNHQLPFLEAHHSHPLLSSRLTESSVRFHFVTLLKGARFNLKLKGTFLRNMARLFKYTYRLARQTRGIKHVYTFKVDKDKKQRLIQTHYEARNLDAYAFFNHDSEYLYTEAIDRPQLIKDLIKCHLN